MAKYFASDPFQRQNEGRAFLTELQQFHQSRGAPFRRPPIINGREVDLFKLYNEVTALGGWNKIIDLNKWEDILEKLGLPRNCANASILLKHIYIRYLNKYERIHFHGEEGDEEVSAESRSNRKSQTSITSMVPMIYHHSQHEVTDQMRNLAGMSLEKYIPTGYEKLCLSLLSNLPNEVDMALNVITLLSSEGQDTLQLSKAPKLIDLLLAHVGIYSEVDKGLQSIIAESWAGLPGGNLSQFWLDTIDCTNVELAQIINDNVCKKGKFENFEDYDEDLFCVNRNLGCHDREGQRILRIALILKNLSFEPDNVTTLAGNSRLLRFILLCTNCKWSELRTVGYDTLGNVSQEIVLRNTDDSTKTLVLRTVVEAMTSQDRFLVIRGLEIISKLCQAEGNDETIFKSLNSQVYNSLCSYLTVRDVCLLIYTLEAIYQLTELGENPCSGIASVHRSIEVLMNLLTVDPQLYGKEALQGMKLVTVHTPQDAHSLQKTPGPISASPQSTPQRAPPPTVLSNSTPKQFNTGIPKVGSVNSPVMLPMEQDPEKYACMWLKTYFMLDYGSCISKQELYNDFVSYSLRSGHKAGIPNQTSFLNCVRLAFPHCGEKKLEDSNGELCLYHDGIRRKPVPSLPTHPLTVTLPPSPTKTPPPTAGASHSPILKAHLSAPPKCPSSPSSTATMSQTAIHQTPSRVSKSKNPTSTNNPSKPKDGNNTTLIKSLLANKVNRNIHQRQMLQDSEIAANKVNANINHDQDMSPVHPSVKTKSKVISSNKKQTKDAPATKSKAAILLAAKLNGVSVVESTIEHENNLEKNLKLTPSKTNGAASEDEKPHEGCDKLIRSVTAGLPVVQNKELELKRREKICKSSPLLNGLLDKGKLSSSDDSLGEQLKLKESVKLNALQNGNSTEIKTDTPPVTPKKPNPSNGTINCLPTPNCVTNSKETVIKPSQTTVAVVPEQNSDSNLSGSDLSSLSDIARTVESASVVINQSSAAAEVVTTVPKEKLIEPALNKQIITNASTVSTVAIPIVTSSPITTQTCIQFVPVLTTQPKIQFISQNNVSVCLNIIQPTDQINISNAKVLPTLKRPIMPSNLASEPKKSRMECSNIIKLEPTNDENGVIIIENGVLQSKEEVTIKTGHQNTISDASSNAAVEEKKMVLIRPAPPVAKVEDKKPVADDKKKKVSNDVNKLEFSCEWQGCGRTFDTAVSVYLHACDVHAPIVSASNNIPCMWDKCDKQPRKRLSLMTHLQDRHCSEQILKINALRKQQISKMGKSTIPVPQNPPAHPGYPPNAAFHAIKRHALQFVCASDVISERNEDVLAKSVRLSSALILRNLVKYSSLGRRRVKQYESKISLLALSKIESSQTLSQCLAALVNPSSNSR